MAYSINKTDGSILATVADGQLDQFSTDITFIGKNYSGFGEVLNENFLKILENFANTSAPRRPVRGQIWFDVTELKLKVYNGLGFVPVSSATIATSRPVTLGVGDLWFDDTNKQLYFYDGQNTILLGPDYSASQGLSGLRVGNVLDTLNQVQVITYLYNNGNLIGIFSKDAFTPKLPIEGFTGDIIPGFNAGNLPGIKFNVTATNADQLGNRPASFYVRNDISNRINGQLILTNNLGLIIGDASQAQLFVNDGNISLANIASNKDINFLVRRGAAGTTETAININSLERKINLYTELESNTPIPEVNVGGNLIVAGNLTVQGDTTTVNTSILTIEDKNVVLASLSGNTSNDEYADGGGVILKGDTDHTLLWSDKAWNSSESINLVSSDYNETPSFKIDGITVLTANTCSASSFPNLNQIGSQLSLTVDSIFVDNNRISTTGTDQNLELAPSGTGNISLLGTPKIVGLQTSGDTDPTINQQEQINSIDSVELTEATNKKYVLSVMRTRPIAVSMVISDSDSDTAIANNLRKIAPPLEYEDGTRARVLCTSITTSSSALNINALINTDTSLFVTPSGGSAPAVIKPIAFETAIIPAPEIEITRIVKEFILQSGTWVFLNNIN
jgi:hypothetical protein